MTSARRPPLAEIILWSALIIGGALWAHKNLLSSPPPPALTGEPFPAQAASAFARQIDLDRIRAGVKQLSSVSSRVTGFPGNEVARNWIWSQWRALGLNVEVQSFSLAVPAPDTATLSSAATRSLRLYAGNPSLAPDSPVEIPLHAVWPNLVRTSQLPPRGITGQLILAGDGELAQFNGKIAKDRIVLLDFNCGTRWLNAAMLGAQAVIFIEPEGTTRGEAEKKYLRVPLDVPRFYVTRLEAERLKPLIGATVTVNCDAHWQRAVGRNLYALIEGTDEKLKNECLALTAYYDSISVVPALAPGAEQACGLATLLELARVLKRNPPRRSVLLVAVDAHAHALQGALRFFDTFGRERGPDRDQRLREHKQRVVELKREIESSGSGARAEGAPARDKSQRGRDRQVARDLQVELAEAEQDRDLAQRFRKFALPLVIGLDLSTQNDTVGVFHMGAYFTNVDLTRFFSPIGQQFTAWLREGLEERKNGRTDVKEGAEERTSGRVDVTAVSSAPPLVHSSALPALPSFIDAINPTKDRNYTFWTPGKIAFDAEMVTRGGRPGITFATVNDARSLVNTPLDRWAKVNFANLKPQVERIAFLVAKTLNDPQTPEMLKRLRGLRDDLSEVEGRTLEFQRRRTFVPSTPVPASLVLVPGTAKSLMGVHADAMTLARTDGAFRLQGQMHYATAELEAYHFDEKTGAIDYAPDRGVDGDVKFPRGVLGRIGLRRPIILFPCKTMSLFDLVDERYFETLERLFVYDARTHIEPVSFGYSPPVSESSVAGPTGGGESLSYVEPVATVYAVPGTRIKVTLGMGLLGIRLALVNGDATKPDGRGFPVDTTPRILLTTLQGVEDLHRLDAHRLADLRKHEVVTPRDLVMQLHEKAGVQLQAARRALEERRYDVAFAAVRAAAGYEANAYPAVQNTVLDTVKGVLFYLALLLPFAYFMERLLFAFAGLRQQIAGTVGVFLLFFFMLRYVHPAFELKVAPAVIFLAFIIIALASMVIVIVVARFNQQLTQMKHESGGVHEADVGRLSATAAAFNLGIANMRRRKARTALTSLTLVLLTFTVLSFTSVQTYLRKNALDLRRAPAYHGIMIRDKAWGPLEEPTLASLRNEFSRSGEGRVSSDKKGRADVTRHSPLVVGRAWISSENYDKRGSYDLISATAPDRKYMVNGLVGLEAEEGTFTGVEKALAAGRWFLPGERLVCVIPESAARQLGIPVKPQSAIRNPQSAAVRIFGETFRVVGIYREKDFEAVRDLDGEPLEPVDYLGLKEDVKQQLKEMREKKLQLGRVNESSLLADYSHFPAGAVAIIPFETAMGFGGTLRSVAVKIDNDAGTGRRGDGATTPRGAVRRLSPDHPFAPFPSPFSVASDLVERFALSIYAGEGGQTKLFSSIGMSGFSGMKDIVLPLLIAAMIVLNTMLGAVYERTKEIGIFSAVGLAPVHIGTLFLAEACVYANLGAIAGYLFGQMVGKTLSHYNVIALTLNYSSMSAVTVTLIVIATVIGSTLYPARKAAQIAVPDVERKWKLPDPSGDAMVIRLPFMLTGGHAQACPAFLIEYFNAYLDYTGGEFYTSGVDFHRIATAEGDGCEIALRMWLAPYDLGVSQMLRLRTTPTAEGHVYEVTIHLQRLSGDMNSWKKTNWLFLNSIRKQFLIWRTLTPASKLEYERRAEGLLGAVASV